MGIIDRKAVERLSELARIELKKSEEEALAGDLERILEYFEELKEVKTDGVNPMSGGTLSHNIFRTDGVGGRLSPKKSIEQFPESKDGFLKVPPVFE